MKRYVVVGTGNRGYLLYARSIVKEYGDCAQLVGLFDPNAKRLAYASETLGGIPTFTDFAQMVSQTAPDVAIITTVDQYHDQYVAHALDLGVDVICEKPIATTGAKCLAILDAERRARKRITLTFNCRFMPHIEQLKRILLSGAIGDVLNVDFEWMLDTRHGADYFRRWHCHMEQSGGLLVHKATHHFDIINYLIAQEPLSVYARGGLRFYGDDRRKHGERCLTCESPCEYRFTEYDHPSMQGLYFQAESEDGYLRDRCIFDKNIDIYDNMNLVVRYSGGAVMSYSLIAHAPYEGWRLTISGTEGRLEASEGHADAEATAPMYQTKVYTRAGDAIVYDVEQAEGSHQGADARMLDVLLRGKEPELPGQRAGSRDGILSALVGICANESIRRDMPIRLTDMVDIHSYYR